MRSGRVAAAAAAVEVPVWCLCMCLLSAPVAVSARIDELFRARCLATCTRLDLPYDNPRDRNECVSACSLTTRTKPGECPPLSSLNVFQTACIHSCSHDVDCEDTDKCCPHDCGATCQPAAGLDHVAGLPRTPMEVSVTDSKRQRCKVVQWAASEGSPVYYVLQERRHPGLDDRNHQFGPWRPRVRRRKNRYLLSDLTPGYWYQVRVAAVNPNGTRGFSPPSKPFRLHIEPHAPNEPQNLTVSRPGWVDGLLWAELHWRRPHSDLPINHYKVYWSHCVKSGSGQQNPSTNPCQPKSVIQVHRNVKYKNTKYILKELQPHSLYFIQVQALTIPYGNKKLSSEKAAIFIDTNKLINASYDWEMLPRTAVKHLELISYHRSSALNLEAKIVWQSTKERFLVKWTPIAYCKTATNNLTNEATTEALHYDIYNLRFNCKYQVSVNVIGSSGKAAKINFKTPNCTEVQSKFSCL